MVVDQIDCIECVCQQLAILGWVAVRSCSMSVNGVGGDTIERQNGWPLIPRRPTSGVGWGAQG